VLSDEIYMRLAFDGCQAPTIAALPGMQERTVICDGFSKTFAMTVWRLGYGIMPEALADRMELLLTHGVGCPASFTQVAGIEALTGPQEEVDAVVAEYQRDVLVEGPQIPGWRCRSPQGAFYVFECLVVRKTSSGGRNSCSTRPASQPCPAPRRDLR
jgi:aspartate/methionine/tyrosine aminotransferase